jgi:cell division protein FtsA
MVIFENGNLISLEVIPMGSGDITNDIALGLKITLEEAENIKVGNIGRTSYSKKKIDDIVSSRLKIVFENINQHLKSIERDGLLPAGIIMSGGGAGLSGLKIFAENYLKLPSQIGEINFSSKEGGRMTSNIWAVSCGLIVVGFNADEEKNTIGSHGGSFMSGGWKMWTKKISKGITQFLP